MTRYALAFVVGLAAGRWREKGWRRVIVALALMLALDLGSAAGHPAPIRAALFVAWPAALALAGGARGIALAILLLAAIVPFLCPPTAWWWIWALRLPRLAALGATVSNLARRPPSPVTGPEFVAALLAAEQAVQLVATWGAPWASWEGARAVTLTCYVCIGAVILWRRT